MSANFMEIIILFSQIVSKSVTLSWSIYVIDQNADNSGKWHLSEKIKNVSWSHGFKQFSDYFENRVSIQNFGFPIKNEFVQKNSQ